MADETVKLILELENKAKKDFDNLNKELKELKKEAKGADEEVKDLDGSLSKTGKSSRQTQRNVKTSTASFKGLAAAAAAAAAAFAAVVANSTALNRELRQLANISGESLENFQLIANQLQALGVNADVTADFLNEVGLKAQEVISLGGGEAAEGFELLNIDNLQEFIRLDAAGRLEQIRKGLSEVNEEQGKLALDIIASDAGIQAGRLLEDINLNLEEVRSQGSIEILTEEESARIAELNAELSRISNNFSVLGAKLTADVAPVLLSTIRDLGELIDTISDSDAFEGATRFVNIIQTLLSSLGSFAVSLTSIFGEFLFFLGNKIPASLTELVLKINELGSQIGVEILSNETITEYEERLEILEAAAKRRVDNINEEFGELGKTLGENAVEVAINANLSLTGDERVLLSDLLDGQAEYIQQFQTARAIVERTFDDAIIKQEILNELLRQQVQFETNRIERTQPQETETQTFNFTLGGFEEELRKAQIELLKLQGQFEKAFDIDIAETNKQLEVLNEQIKTAQEVIASGSGTEKLENDLKLYQEQSAALTELLELQREQAILQEQQFIEDEAQQRFDLNLISEDDFIKKLEGVRDVIKETFGEDSIEFNAFNQQLQETIANLDTFGQISLRVFEDFSAGFAQAATDALLSGASLRDGLGNVFASIAQQLLQAAIQALIFSAIISSIGGGFNPQNLSFGQLFQQNLGANLGVPVRHNGGSVGREGDANNSIKRINLADPSGSLNPNERLIIAKTDESVVKTSSLNSPTGIGSNQPTQPEVKINNYITDDVLNAFLTSDAAQDTIVNIVNNNNDRIR